MESLRRNGVAIMVNKRVQNAVLGCNPKKDRMISVHFQGKLFSVTVIHAYGATQDGWVMVERSDRMWSTGEGNSKPLQYSCLENPMNSMKRQNDRILKEELPRSVGAQHATGDQWRNN